MIEVVPYEAAHLLELNLQRGQEYVQDCITPKYAKQLEATEAYTVMADGKPVAVMGLLPLWNKRALAWTFIDRQAGPYMVPIHKRVKAFLQDAPFDRIEADTPVDFDPGHRWLEMLGFELEAVEMKKYYIDGRSGSLYAMVKHG